MANLLDKLISYVNPEAGVRRLQASTVLRAYEAANAGGRWKKWNASGSGPDTEVASARKTSANRARDLVRNNPFASNGLQVLTSSIVGCGFMPSLGDDNATEELWAKWAETKDCDAEGIHTFAGLQRLAVRSAIESGQSFIRLVKVSSARNKSVPIKLQVLESDFLDTGKTSLSSRGIRGNIISNGIEFNDYGERVAYWLYRTHPSEMESYNAIESVRVPAEEVAHIYRMDRPGQSLGISWFSPVVTKIRDVDEYAEAQLVKQKLSAVFAAFIHDSEASDLPEKNLTEDDDIAFGAGTISTLGPGKEITFSDPPSVANYPEYMKSVLASIATGIGITYESLTNDLSQVNFSSARIGATRMKRNVEDWQENMVIPMLLSPVWEWFASAARISGVRVPDAIEWTAPRFELVDPTREIPAIRDEVRAGLVSQSEALRRLGYNPKRVFEEISKDNETLDKLGIVLDTDPRKTSAAGLTQARPDGEGGTAIPSPDVGQKGK